MIKKKSFIEKLNRIRPNTETWETPEIMFLNFYECCLYNALCAIFNPLMHNAPRWSDTL